MKQRSPKELVSSLSRPDALELAAERIAGGANVDHYKVSKLLRSVQPSEDDMEDSGLW